MGRGCGAASVRGALSPAQQAALLAAMSDGVLAMDADGRVVYADERFAAMTGYAADAVLGVAPPFEWWPDEPVGVMHDGIEAVLRCRDGRRRVVHVTDRPVAAGAGTAGGGRVRVLRTADDASEAQRWRCAAAEAVALRHVAEAGGRDVDPVSVLQVAARELATLLCARSVAVYHGDAASVRLLAVHGGAEHGAGAVDLPEPGSALEALSGGAPWVATARQAGIEVPVGGGERGMLVVDHPAGGADRCRELLGRFREALTPAVAGAESRARLTREAATDSLTGLANHRTFHERLADEVARAKRHGRPLSLCVFDIDNFKDINDLHGHQAGDRALVVFADNLRRVARAGDLVARGGGDEFAWVLPEADGARALEAVGRLRELIDAAAHVEGERILASAGVCDVVHAHEASHLFSLADGALYWAKTHGRDQSRLYDPAAGDVMSSRERLLRGRRSRAGLALRALADKVDAMHARYDHSERVAVLAARLAVAAGWTAGDVADLREAARLHDIGKIGLPDGPPPTTIADAIAWGPTDRRFALLGSQLAADTLSAEQCEWIHDQREPYDASNRPARELPYGGHIIAVADAWDLGMNVAGPAGVATGALFDALNEWSGTRFCPRVMQALGRVDLGDGLRAPGFDPAR